MLGALHTVVLCGVTALLLAACVAAWLATEDGFTARSSAGALSALAVTLLVFTALQAIPLPIALVGALSPASADAWSRALLPLHEPGPGWCTLSLDPVATRVEVLRGAAYLVAFLAAVGLTRRRSGIYFCLLMLIASGTLVGLASVLHPAFGATRVFGVYKPATAINPRHIAPILNANALSGYLNIGLLIALSLGISKRTAPTARVGFLCVAFFLGAVQLWVASRGGVLSMLVGAVVVLWLSRRRASARVALLRSALPVGLAVAAGVALLVIATSEKSAAELGEHDVSKLRVFGQVVPMVRAFWLTGAGRGAFESVFPAFREGRYHYVYTHPENLPLQWASEWGVPVALLAGAVLLWGLRPRVALRRGEWAIGPWAALLALGLHNLVDFSSEVPGVVVALAVCAGLVVGGSASTASVQASTGWRKGLLVWAERPRRVALGAALVAVIGIAWAAPTLGRSLYDDRDSLRALAASGPSRETFDTAARAAMLRHPAEPYLPFAGALYAQRSHAEPVIPWVERTLERARVYGPAHFVLAQWLRRRSPSQARLEYRTALDQAPELIELVLAEAPSLVSGPTSALEIVPQGDVGVTLLQRLTSNGLFCRRLPATCIVLDDDLAARSGGQAPDVWERRAGAVVSDLRDGDAAPWCARDVPACVHAGVDAADRLIALDPRQCRGYALRAELRALGGQLGPALTDLERASSSLVDEDACARAALGLAREMGNDDQLTQATDLLQHASCGSPEACVANLQTAADAEEARHHDERAVAIYRRAALRFPEQPEGYVGVARITSRLGLHAEALEAYGHLARLQPDNAQWASLAAAERQALVGGR